MKRKKWEQGIIIRSILLVENQLGKKGQKYICKIIFFFLSKLFINLICKNQHIECWSGPWWVKVCELSLVGSQVTEYTSSMLLAPLQKVYLFLISYLGIHSPHCISRHIFVKNIWCIINSASQLMNQFAIVVGFCRFSSLYDFLSGTHYLFFSCS